MGNLFALMGQAMALVVVVRNWVVTNKYEKFAMEGQLSYSVKDLLCLDRQTDRREADAASIE